MPDADAQSAIPTVVTTPVAPATDQDRPSPAEPPADELNDFSEDEQAEIEATESDQQAPKSKLQSMDPRHIRRAKFMQQVFSYSFHLTPERKEDFLAKHPDVQALMPELPEIDATIQKFAPERPVDQINKVDLAILRTIMFEWRTSDTPKKVLINEAVELGKEFGTESTPKFVNGVLAQLLK